MLLVTVRMPEEFVAHVSRAAKTRNISESAVWREVVHEGIYLSRMNADAQRATLNFSVQALCLARRMAGLMDEDLIAQAESDAKRTLDDIDVR